MSQHVADANDLRPWNVWLGRLHVGLDMARGRLGDNLDAVLHVMPKQRVAGDVLKRLAPHRMLDSVYGLKTRLCMIAQRRLAAPGEPTI